MLAAVFCFLVVASFSATIEIKLTIVEIDLLIYASVVSAKRCKSKNAVKVMQYAIVAPHSDSDSDSDFDLT